MDRKGYNAIKEIFTDRVQILPKPEKGEDVRFIEISFDRTHSAGRHRPSAFSILCELEEAGFIYRADDEAKVPGVQLDFKSHSEHMAISMYGAKSSERTYITSLIFEDVGVRSPQTEQQPEA